jgi:hypothetical protein
LAAKHRVTDWNEKKYYFRGEEGSEPIRRPPHMIHRWAPVAPLKKSKGALNEAVKTSPPAFGRPCSRYLCTPLHIFLHGDQARAWWLAIRLPRQIDGPVSFHFKGSLGGRNRSDRRKVLMMRSEGRLDEQDRTREGVENGTVCGCDARSRDACSRCKLFVQFNSTVTRENGTGALTPLH